MICLFMNFVFHLKKLISFENLLIKKIFPRFRLFLIDIDPILQFHIV